ncbi:MAG: ribose 5-phosphate isomerase B, partial [Verrucomicrobiota bacterium]
MKTLLFVCTGNTCRSPMAEGIARQVLADTGNWRVVSAGTGAINGQPPSPNAVKAMRLSGVDISGHRSQMVNARLVEEATLILGLTRGHVDNLLYLYPQASTKTFTLGQFDTRLRPKDQDIADPIGGSLEEYLSCRDQIKSGIEALLVSSVLQPLRPTARTAFAVGSDHAGFDLKQELLGELRRIGLSYEDVGTHSTESTDYPDYAHEVSHRVASGQASLGLLCCSTGIGMSMAANKVTGIRAALVTSEEMARLTRQHNDANVLCLGARNNSAADCVKILHAFVEAQFEGGRHERRIQKIEDMPDIHTSLESTDPSIAQIVEKERQRQQEHIELIASENFTSPAVM